MSPSPYKPIEYIGRKPRHKEPRAGWGGLIILVLAISTASFFGLRFSPLFSAEENQANGTSVEAAISHLGESKDFGDRLAAAALKRTQYTIRYDNQPFQEIAYPMGDVAGDTGTNADLIIRSYRSCDVDLQQRVHEDMQQNFRVYPQIWGEPAANPHIDHRRVANLQRYFTRKGESLNTNRDLANYEIGDVVAWFPNSGHTHIGIVVPGPGELSGEKWVVHNFDKGPVWEDALFDFDIIGHYRYQPQSQ